MKSATTSPLSKDDAEQLQMSGLWVRENVPKISKCVSLIGSNVDRADNVGDFAFGAEVLTEVDVLALLERLRRVVAGVTANGPLFASSAANVQKYLGSNEIQPAQIEKLARTIKQKK